MDLGTTLNKQGACSSSSCTRSAKPTNDASTRTICSLGMCSRKLGAISAAGKLSATLETHVPNICSKLMNIQAQRAEISNASSGHSDEAIASVGAANSSNNEDEVVFTMTVKRSKR
eukprot:4933943-Amphidinium_carterae.2